MAAASTSAVAVAAVGDMMEIDTSVLPACMAKFVDTGSTESHRFYLARRTVLEMLRDRGYNVPAEDLGLTLPDFRENFGSVINLQQLEFRAAHPSEPSNKVLVIFGGTNVYKITDIKGILDRVRGQGFSGLILVLQNEMTAPAKKAAKEANFKVELFKPQLDLLTIITKHKFMPRHDVLSIKEKEELLKKYSVVEKQLPCMLEGDAIARYYGLSKGEVVKITYTGDSAKGHVTYRCVV